MEVQQEKASLMDILDVFTGSMITAVHCEQCSRLTSNGDICVECDEWNQKQRQPEAP